ncbi:hypothetical protein ACOL3I_11840, partial [Aliarcobacter butzleri]
ILPTHHKISVFLPHAGLKPTFEESNKIQDFEEYKKQKTIDIFSAGTFLKDIEKIWPNHENYPTNLLGEVFELFMYDDYL